MNTENLADTTSARDVPFYSRCSAGKNRWFWAAWNSHRAFNDGFHNGEPALDSGYETTAEGAERCGREAIGRPSQGVDRPWYARQYRRRLVCEKRAKKQTDNADAVAVEFVYRYADNGPLPDMAIPHRVVRRTAGRVYVSRDRWSFECAPGREPDAWYRFDVRTFVLDLAELERDGQAWSHSRCDRFYLSPTPPEPVCVVPECIAALGLSWPCGLDEVRRAFRAMAKVAHPDTGGRHEDFVALRENYEAAEKLIADHVAVA